MSSSSPSRFLALLRKVGFLNLNSQLATRNLQLRGGGHNSQLATRNLQHLDDRKAAGFSLIEVNVAILVIAGGMLSLFTLFPAGLRMSTAAMSDTRQAFFADQFFAFFENGLLLSRYNDPDSRTMADVYNWQDITKFWNAGQKGLELGFNANFDNADWPDNNLRKAIKDSWDPSGLKDNDKSFKKDSGKNGSDITLRFRSGEIKKYFCDSKVNKDPNFGLAEFVVRIASDFAHRKENGNGSWGLSHNLDDGLVWRVSLIVSDEGENGWFYDNPVYHRDFRYAELP